MGRDSHVAIVYSSPARYDSCQGKQKELVGQRRPLRTKAQARGATRGKRPQL